MNPDAYQSEIDKLKTGDLMHDIFGMLDDTDLLQAIQDEILAILECLGCIVSITSKRSVLLEMQNQRSHYISVDLKKATIAVHTYHNPHQPYAAFFEMADPDCLANVFNHVKSFYRMAA